MKNITNPVNAYTVTLLASNFGKLRGWIELKNGDKLAGYIYLSDEAPLPRDYLGSNDYIVMHQTAKLMGVAVENSAP